jgi:hypothetical protein
MFYSNRASDSQTHEKRKFTVSSEEDEYVEAKTHRQIQLNQAKKSSKKIDIVNSLTLINLCKKFVSLLSVYAEVIQRFVSTG